MSLWLNIHTWNKCIMYSYHIYPQHVSLFFSPDTVFCNNKQRSIYSLVSPLFQCRCETVQFRKHLTMKWKCILYCWDYNLYWSILTNWSGIMQKPNHHGLLTIFFSFFQCGGGDEKTEELEVHVGWGMMMRTDFFMYHKKEDNHKFQLWWISHEK